SAMPRDRDASITAGLSQTVIDSASPARLAARANEDPTRPAPTIAMRLNIILTIRPTMRLTGASYRGILRPARTGLRRPRHWSAIKMPWRLEPANSYAGRLLRQSIEAVALIDRTDQGAMTERHRKAHFRDRDELRSATRQHQRQRRPVPSAGPCPC